MPFRIINDAAINSLTTLSKLKIPIVTTLPGPAQGVTQGGQFMGLVTATGVDLYYYDGDTWFHLVDSTAAGGGLVNVLAINNNSGGVDNIIIDNTMGAGVGALTSVVGGSLNILAGGAATSVPGTTETLHLASGDTGKVDIDGGSLGVEVDTAGPFSIDGGAASNVSTAGAGSDLTVSTVGPGSDLTVSSAAGKVVIIGGEAVSDAVKISALSGGVVIDGSSDVDIDAVVDVNLTAGVDVNLTADNDICQTVSTVTGLHKLVGGKLVLDSFKSVSTSVGGPSVAPDAMHILLNLNNLGDTFTLGNGVDGQHLFMTVTSLSSATDTLLVSVSSLLGYVANTLLFAIVPLFGAGASVHLIWSATHSTWILMSEEGSVTAA